jgi:hypothetical protein
MRYQMNLPDAPGPRPGGVSCCRGRRVEKKVDNIVDVGATGGLPADV